MFFLANPEALAFSVTLGLEPAVMAFSFSTGYPPVDSLGFME